MKKKVDSKKDERPWGNYEVLFVGQDQGFQVKRILVKPGAKFSLQTHSRRREIWTIVAGEGVVTCDEKKIPIAKGSVVDIPQGAKHRMENTGRESLIFIEVQLGDYLGEDDIVRLEDDYGRVGY